MHNVSFTVYSVISPVYGSDSHCVCGPISFIFFISGFSLFDRIKVGYIFSIIRSVGATGYLYVHIVNYA